MVKKMAKEKNRKIEYTDGPMKNYKISDFKIIPNFLPPPEVLARGMKRTKITISLSSDSIDFFKEEAEKHNVQYQRMIRQVLDEYVQHHRQSGTK